MGENAKDVTDKGLISERASQVVLVVKNVPAKAGDIGDAGLIPASGRSPGEGNGSPFQSSCLETSMDRGAWWATVHRVTESDMTEAILAHSTFCEKPLSLIRSHLFILAFISIALGD